MSSDQPPEDKVRAVRDKLVGGIVESQHRTGMLPDVEAAQRFATGTLEQLLKERRSPESHQSSPSAPAEEDRAQAVEEGTRFIARPVGSYNFGTGTFKQLPGVPLRESRQDVEQRLLHERLALLSRIPEWRKRVLDAWFSPGNPDARAARVMNVVIDSDRVFGKRRPVREPLLVVSR